MSQTGGVGAKFCLDVGKFLERHPEVLIGREALNKAEAKIRGRNTIDLYGKPFSNVVLIQKFDTETKKRYFAVALVNDENAEICSERNNVNLAAGSDSIRHKCARAVVDGPDDLLFECLSSKCEEICCETEICTVDDRCPNRVFTGNNCDCQLNCKRKDAFKF